MKKMALCILILACITGFAFAGGRKAQDTAGGTITLSGYMQIDPADPQYAYWPVTLEAFAAKYPNIKLDFEYVTGEQFHDKFQAMAATGTIPDLFTCYAGARSSYILNRGMVKDLRPYLTDSFKANYTSAIWDPQGPNGEIWIISPNLAVCTVIYVNPKLQKELGLANPKSLDEMIAQIPAIQAAGYTSLMFGNSAIWPGSSLLLSCLVDRMGGTAWFNQAMAGTAKFSDKPFVDAIAVIKKMIDAKLLPTGTNQLSGMDAISAFAQGKSVYLLQSGWIQSALKGAASKEDYDQYQVMAFPEIAGEVTHGSSAATLGEALAMNTKLTGDKADAAWKFLSFIYGEEGMDLMMKYGNVVTYKLDLSKYDVDNLNKQYINLINNQSMGYVIDAKMDGEGVNNILNPGIQAVMLGDKTPEALAAEYEAWVAANDSNRKK
ncbi:MAG: extracellular solute-binding protein [Treponema sp.]|jgi:raffinose/stachyose/melibiose transport system substrate-binding protein|nr:extracellular solute-binding protein [Treponema sp.]